MNDKELSALKALAEAASLNDWPFHGIAFQKAANPAAILSLISRIESADLLAAHYEMLCQSKDARIAELEAKVASRCRAQGGNTWDKDRITELSKCIAKEVAENAGTVPELTFPHIYLGLIDALLAPAATSTKPDGELPGMWENADFSGGETDAAISGVAGAGEVKTWRQRVGVGYEECDEREARDAEIADLRAKLAQTTTAFDAAVLLAGETIDARNAEVAELREKLAHQQAPVGDSVDTPEPFGYLIDMGGALGERFVKADELAPEHGMHAECVTPLFTAWKDAQLARERQDQKAVREVTGVSGFYIEDNCGDTEI